jgi:hypothetical protein
MRVIGVGITPQEQVIVRTVIQVDPVLVPTRYHLCLEEILVVDCAGLAIEGLNYDLLAILLQEHVRDKGTVEEIHIVAREQSVVHKQRWQNKQRVAYDGGDGWHEDGRYEERVYDARVQESAAHACCLSRIEIDLLLVHAHYWVHAPVPRMLYKVKLSLRCHNGKGTSLGGKQSLRG